ncbi:MAG TPA: lipopolysaccharide heptosyltransferase I [Methylibium sp.]
MRVLIVKLSSLGDVVHAMPVVHDIRRARPGAAIDWVVEPGFAPLVRRVDGVREVIECAVRRWRKAWWTSAVRTEWRAFRERLQRERYDAVLDLQGLTKSALIARLASVDAVGHRYGLGNRTDGAGWEPTARWLVDRPIFVAPRTHALDRSRLLAAQALGYELEASPVFGLNAQAKPYSPPVVAFVHGSSREDKLWPEAHWIELGRRLIDESYGIALPQGSEDERRRAERIADALGPAAKVWPGMGLDTVVDCLAGCTGVIGVDSGLSHIAVALDLPHVQLYNFKTAWRTGPQRSHGHEHQVSIGGDAPPGLEEVWQAWLEVRRPGREVDETERDTQPASFTP